MQDKSDSHVSYFNYAWFVVTVIRNTVQIELGHNYWHIKNVSVLSHLFCNTYPESSD